MILVLDYFGQGVETHFWWTSVATIVVSLSEQMNQVKLESGLALKCKILKFWEISVQDPGWLAMDIGFWMTVSPTIPGGSVAQSLKMNKPLLLLWLTLVIPGMQRIFANVRVKMKMNTFAGSVIGTLINRDQKSGGLFLFTPNDPQTTEVRFLI